ncbi:MAG: pilus assembly protein PilM [Deltaproteobacteria bacterium]|nr:pilus assembly protein PilM [Deltaproteobacteria bacterium]MBI4374281.1 pilus assembly protein PilM [Deltaproteobacteria bacterium]
MQRVLGVDVGTYSIKVVEIERSFRDFKVVGFYEQRVSSSTEGGEAQAIQRLFEEYNLSSDFIYSALPGHLTSFRVVDFPFSNFKKIDATIEFEMEEYLPIPIEEAVVDYKILVSDKTHSKVLVSYARKGGLIKFLNRFAAAELDARFVGSELVEMTNLRKLGVSMPEGAYAIVELGHTKTNLCLFFNGELRVTRTIMIGGRDLTHAIAQALKISPPEAEKIKTEMGQVGEVTGVGDPMVRQVAESMKRVLNDLLVQIRQTFATFQEMSGEVVQALLLTGGTSRLGGIEQFFSKSLRKNVSFLDALDLPVNQLNESSWCRPIIAPALALAYRGVIGVGTRDLQFRRGEFAYRGEIRDLTGLVKSVVVQIGIISFIVLGTFLFSYFSLRDRLEDQREKIAALASETLPELAKKSLSQPKNVLSILNGRIGESSEKKRKLQEETALSVLEALKEVSRSLPPRDAIQIDIDQFTYAGGKIRLAGQTNSFEAVDQLKTALTRSPQFQNIATTNVRKGVGDQVKFDLSFDLKIQGDAEAVKEGGIQDGA